MSTGRFIWHDLVTTDPEKSKGFYGELLNWTFETIEMPTGPYTMFGVNGNNIGGLMKSDMPFSHWLGYVTSDDVDATLSDIKAAGGEAVMPATDIPDVGRFAIFKDPQGAVLAVISLNKEDPESNERPAVGTFCWNELLTNDPKAAAAFYTRVLKWDAKESPMKDITNYTILMRGERQSAGMMKSPMPNIPPHWMNYIHVEDCDASGAKAEKMGAKIIVPGTDIPGVGRFVMITDPTGAAVALFTGKESG